MSSIHTQNIISNSDLSRFCNQIYMILKAGISPYEGISLLLEDTDPKTKEILSIVYEQLENGQSLSASLEESGVFPSYLLHMVHLGEETGHLEDVFLSLSKYYEREASIRESIRHAVSYPLIMTGMMLLVLLVLMWKVLPVFNHIYTELGSQLTGFAGAMAALSIHAGTYLLILLLVLLALAAILVAYLRSPSGRLFIASRPLSMAVATSRFSNVMALVLSSGFDTDEGLVLAKDLVGNIVMEEKINKCQEMIADGATFHSAVIETGIFSGVQKSMVLIGDRTGATDIIMQDLCEEYSNIADDKVTHFISIIEPTLVILLSVIIGVIMLSFLVPLISVMSSLGGGL